MARTDEQLREDARSSVDTVLGPSKVAERLDVTEKTLAQWRWQSKGPRWFRLEGGVRYLESDVDTYIAEKREKTGPRLAS